MRVLSSADLARLASGMRYIATYHYGREHSEVIGVGNLTDCFDDIRITQACGNIGVYCIRLADRIVATALDDGPIVHNRAELPF
jgi:hypothetical protein